MTANNDERILKLRKQIDKKTEELGKINRRVPLTHSNFVLDGNRLNILALDKEKLIALLVKLNAYRMSAQQLWLLDEFIIEGYILSDWIEDIQSRLTMLSQMEERKTLRITEEKLSKMLSGNKRVELELDDIESLLKGY